MTYHMRFDSANPPISEMPQRAAQQARMFADILKQERHWQRDNRIAHATYRMATAANAEEHLLWSKVLAANTGDTPPRPTASGNTGRSANAPALS